jgi:hypothetical protein
MLGVISNSNSSIYFLPMAKITLPIFSEAVNKSLSELAPYYADGQADRIDTRYVYSDRLSSIKVIYNQSTLKLLFQEAIYESEEVYDLDQCLQSIIYQWIEDYPEVATKTKELRAKMIKDLPGF